MSGFKIELGQQFYRVVNPGVSIPSDSIVVHKLRPADLEAALSPAQVLEEFATFSRGAVLVGHFASIDVGILAKELDRSGERVPGPAICTARVQRWIVKHQPYAEDQYKRLEEVDLASMAKTYEVEMQEAHHALDDAFVTARVWQKQLHILRRMGVETVGRLFKFARV